MTNFIDNPAPQKLVRISGEMRALRVTRQSASFVFTESDETKFGVIAVVAALAGMGGQAMSVASNATAMEEEADYIDFNLDGIRVCGWLWRNPFNEGDLVNIVAEWRSDHYELLGVSRPADQTIALYPHCTRSRWQHVKNSIKWWLYVSIFFDMSMLVLTATMDSVSFKEVWGGVLEDGSIWFLLGMHIAFGVATYSITKQWAPFADVAEKVFKTLDLTNSGKIDLKKSSKGRHQKYDSLEYGSMYFRY